MDLCALAESLAKGDRNVTVVPNGSTTTALDLALLGKGFKIMCSPRLVRELFPLGPFVTEFGSKEDVVVTVDISLDEVRSKVLGLL